MSTMHHVKIWKIAYYCIKYCNTVGVINLNHMERLLTACILFLAFSACSGDGSRETSGVEERGRSNNVTEEPSGSGSSTGLQAEADAQSRNNAQHPADGNAVQSGSAESSPEQSRKLVKDGNIQIQVEDYKKERDSILALLKRFEGYVASENESRQSYRLSNNFTLRVPSGHFDALMDAIAKRAEQVTYRNVNVRDVTGQYYDLELRIRNKKELEKRYLEILSRAGTVKEMLEIEATLNEVRTEIESMEGSFKLLSSQIEYSTINLTIFKVLEYTYEPVPRPGFGQRVMVALQAGWNGFLSLLVGLVHIWPLFLVSALIVFIILRWNRRKQAAGRNKPQD